MTKIMINVKPGDENMEEDFDIPQFQVPEIPCDRVPSPVPVPEIEYLLDDTVEPFSDNDE
jgi:hypothetical protein